MNFAPHLDYALAWRWLLPASSNGVVRFIGFPTEEESFLREKLTELSCQTGADDVGLALVCAENLDFNDASAKAIEDAHTVCVVAGRAQAAAWRKRLSSSFPNLREYGLLPAANPRMAFPLHPSRTIMALSLHRPGRLLARASLRFAAVMARLGNYALLRGRVLLVATKSPDCTPLGAVRANCQAFCADEDVDFALYFGTPDANRKTVALPLGHWAPKVLLKAAELPKAHASTRNEAAVLSALQSSSLAEYVPKVLGMVESPHSLTLVQEYRQRTSVGKQKMRDAVLVFLAELARQNVGTVRLDTRLRDLPEGLGKRCSPELANAVRTVMGKLEKLADAGLELVVHRSHGDFAPWNCSWTNKGFFVYDWEASHAQDVAFGDAFYYVIAPALLVQQKANVIGILRSALRLTDQVKAGADMASEEVKIYLALWLINRLKEGGLYGELLVALEREWA